MERNDFLGRRGSCRLKQKYLVCYRARRKDGTYGTYDSTLTRNISAGGMNIVIDQYLNAGTELEITLRCPLFPQKAVPITGVVVKSNPDLLGQKLFKTRVKFIDFDPMLLRVFKQYIDAEIYRRVGGVPFGRTLDRRKQDRRQKPRGEKIRRIA